MILLGLYQLLYPLVVFAALARVARARRWGAFREGLADAAERLGRPVFPSSGAPVLWVHAASVGEVTALRHLLTRWGHMRVVVTCMTAAGREKARGLPGVSAAFLAPADFYPCVASFLTRVRPAALINAESEIWPMTLAAAAGRGVGIGLVNACLSERSAARWAFGVGLSRRALAGVRRAAYQTEEDRARFEALGAPRDAGCVTGNTKYDLKPPAPEAVAAAKDRVATLFGAAPLWTAGSTRPGEESLVLEAHRKAAARVPGLRLILAPRHTERASELAALLKESGLSFVRWSELLPFANTPEVLLVDTMGALGALYGLGAAAFVGGTLVPGSGGHNVLEPAAAGVPVLFGPHIEAVRYEARALQLRQGCVQVADADALAEGLVGLLEDPVRRQAVGRAAKATAEAFQGATDRAFDWLLPICKA
ncbi:MAG: 3-deoxy-D-manno-octulosonic acid transferase [Elusimicrobia bacterium]|nr:3-deoxy-D-manno-octulosonic acid transferase [Elusimicrobiota bacterium]